MMYTFYSDDLSSYNAVVKLSTFFSSKLLLENTKKMIEKDN